MLQRQKELKEKLYHQNCIHIPKVMSVLLSIDIRNFDLGIAESVNTNGSCCSLRNI